MRIEGLGSWPASRARKPPHRTALHERTTSLAHALRHAGVRRGDRLVRLGPNPPT